MGCIVFEGEFTAGYEDRDQSRLTDPQGARSFCATRVSDRNSPSARGVMALPEPPQTTVEAAVLHDLARGKLEALEALYDQLAEYLYGLAVRICGDDARAEGIVEQVFTEVWNNRDRGTVITAFVPKLLARCRELALRSRIPAPQPVGATPVTPATGVPSRAGGVASAWSRALDRIPADSRATLEIAYFEGLPHDAIAARTGTTRSRVLEHLRVSLDELGPLLGSGALPGAGS